MRQWLRDAFSLEGGYEPLCERELQLLERIAAFLVRRHMQMPAILMLESIKPLGYVGSQAMAFFEPVVKVLFNAAEYTEVRLLLEKRQSIEALIQKIEEQERAASEAKSNEEVSDEKLR